MAALAENRFIVCASCMQMARSLFKCTTEDGDNKKKSSHASLTGVCTVMLLLRAPLPAPCVFPKKHKLNTQVSLPHFSMCLLIIIKAASRIDNGLNVYM